MNKQTINSLPILIISAYRKFVSPMIRPHCRFHPTCSAYSLEAFQQNGFFRAVMLSLVRIGKCHPFHPGGYDPLPQKKEIDNG